ncbi:Copia protein [Vitis vinifera]|uniref:Copia protein n=1 Tax=Vitis vinifera TaxID=29760 RepID=A0A438GU88_VITVI|nr:Copia protein [Vitis vinifera]
MEEGFQENSTATVAEIKTEANVDEKASALVAATDHGDRFHPLDLPHKKLFPQPMDIQTRQTIGCGIKRGKLYYLDFQSKDSNKLQQALMADGSEGEKKKSEIWLWHRRLGHASFEVVRASLIVAKTPISYWGEAITSAAYLINRTLDYDYHISEEDESRQSELVNQEAGELDMSGQQFGSEDVFTEIPNQSSSVEGVLNLEPDPFMKRLPHCHNRAIPNSVQEALADPRWKAAMNEEMKSLQKNETWELVECPPGKKPVGCHWIYTVKYKADVKINTVRVLLSLAANLDWPLQQFDVKNAFLHGGNLVTWKSKKQNVVARSSAEAEFRGMALGLCEALWLRLLLQDLGYLSRQPIRLFCDNKVVCDIAHNPVQHDRTKHVEVDRFFIKEKLDDKIVELPNIRSEDQLADILTKAVSSQVFSKFLDKLGMCDIYAPT